MVLAYPGGTRVLHHCTLLSAEPSALPPLRAASGGELGVAAGLGGDYDSSSESGEARCAAHLHITHTAVVFVCTACVSAQDVRARLLGCGWPHVLPSRFC